MMATPFQDLLKELPEAEQQAIAAGTRQLIDEYLTLQDLRKARALTQERMAEMLGINQESISRLEKRSDLLLSTLSSYVTAMGGRLQLVAEFPDRPPSSFPGLAWLMTPRRSRRGPGKETGLPYAMQRPHEPARPGSAMCPARNA
jgi:DNA-binding XRE family transcriptional regulator